MSVSLAGCGKDAQEAPPAANDPVDAITGVPGLDGQDVQEDDPEPVKDDGAAADPETSPYEPVEPSDGRPAYDPDAAYQAVLTVRDYGAITMELDPKAAPETVRNFVTLAMDGFYDGLTFHRIIDGFMIQGGDPLGNGLGGSGTEIYGEFASNGWSGNDILHVRGTVSMARSSDPDSASSQFFIMHGDADYLDGEYAAFGRVTNGMDVVDAIVADASPVDGNGTILPEDQPVIESVVIAAVSGGPDE